MQTHQNLLDLFVEPYTFSSRVSYFNKSGKFTNSSNLPNNSTRGTNLQTHQICQIITMWPPLHGFKLQRRVCRAIYFLKLRFHISPGHQLPGATPLPRGVLAPAGRRPPLSAWMRRLAPDARGPAVQCWPPNAHPSPSPLGANCSAPPVPCVWCVASLTSGAWPGPDPMQPGSTPRQGTHFNYLSISINYLLFAFSFSLSLLVA